jgi:hypothetical protein
MGDILRSHANVNRGFTHTSLQFVLRDKPGQILCLYLLHACGRCNNGTAPDQEDGL